MLGPGVRKEENELQPVFLVRKKVSREQKERKRKVEEKKKGKKGEGKCLMV